MTAIPVPAPHRPTGRRRFVGALASLALSVSALAGVAVASPAQATSTDDAAGFVASINAERVSAGRSAYLVSPDLGDVAHRWAVTMASGSSLRHNPQLAGQVTGWRFVGENVGVGSGVAELHKAFMNSPAHRRNVMDGDFTQVGIGVAYGGGRLWVTEVFRRPAATAAAAVARPAARPAAPVYRIGSTGQVVKRIQRRVGVRADGRYGRSTYVAVQRWQRAHGLAASGVVTTAGRRAMRV